MPKVSVIVPVYNSVKYLQDAVNSILNQDFSDFELLLMDDGSTDGSSELCDSIATQDERVRVFHLENGGQCRARNIAIDHALGDYITFSDNDDCCLPGFLSEPYDIATSSGNEIDCVCFGRILRQYSESGDLVYESVCRPSRKAVLFDDEVFDNYDLWKECSDGVWCRLYRRTFLRDNKIYFDEALRHGAEDALFNAKVLDKLQSVAYIPKDYYVWIRRESHSSSMSISEDTLNGLKEVLEIESSTLIKNGVSKKDPKILGERLLGHLIFQIINVRYKKNPSFKIEKELYEKLREIYLPYYEVIDRDALPFAYRLELELIMKRRYKTLYSLLRTSGFLRKLQGKKEKETSC